MNYINYLKEQTKIAILAALSALISYTIACRFGWREPITISIGHITALTSALLTFIVGGSCWKWYWEEKK